MQLRFGNEFSHVRVHTGGKAGASASSLDAAAYTLGSDIVFASGRYAPHTTSGRRLIAHEIAHVVQQGGPEAPRTANEALLENDANQAASNAMEGIDQTQVACASATRLSREPSNEEEILPIDESVAGAHSNEGRRGHRIVSARRSARPQASSRE